jgi:hypothetical protein
MARSCARCGKELAGGSRQRFCGSDCKQAAYRARKSGVPESKTSVVVDLPHNPGAASVVSTTRAELAAVDRLNTSLGQAAVALAERIDNARAVMGFAALVKELRDTMREAMKDVEDDSDALDEIRASAALKLIRSGSA